MSQFKVIEGQTKKCLEESLSKSAKFRPDRVGAVSIFANPRTITQSVPGM